MPYYNAGDYYGRGDYYQGDPGIFSFLGGLAKKAIGVIAPAALGFITGGPAGGILGAVKGTVSSVEKGIREETLAAGGANPPMIAPPASVGLMAPGGGGRQIITQSPLGTPVSFAGLQHQLMPFGMRRTHPNRSTYVTRGGGTSRWPVGLQVHPKGTEQVTSRRMNVGNARALRRGLRRLRGFAKLAHKVLRVTHQYKGKGFGGRRRKK